MIKKVKPFDKNYPDDTYIDDINRDIEKLNRLIGIYNSASLAKKGEVLLQVHQQLFKIDANIGGTKTVHAIMMNLFNYTQFYQDLSHQIHQELSNLGCPGFSAKQINQWDLENCRKTESIPSALLFKEETKPGFIKRMFGSQVSTPIATATRLLSEIDPRLVDDNTEKNYFQLSKLKHALRDLIAAENISTSGRVTLNNLIAKVNNRLHDIVENNLQLRSQVYPSLSINLAQGLSNLSYKNAQNITETLSNPSEFNAEMFHQEFDKIIPGLGKYSIKYLGGENAKNYLLTDNETSERQVLKITPNTGNSRKAYERLKETSVKDGIAEVYATKHAIQSENCNIYSLELTEFCAKGDVLSHGMKVQYKISLIQKEIAGLTEESDNGALKKLYEEFGLADQEEINVEDKQRVLSQLKDTQILNTVNIYGQMTDVFLSFQENNAFFPDAKPTNFLINEFDQVLIADTKTFLNTEDGLVHPGKIVHEGLLQYTPCFRSPQFEQVDSIDTPFSADKEHAYLMGLSLYCYITGTNISETPKNSKDHAAFMNLDNEVFQSPKGQKFKELIQGLTNLDADLRMGIQQAKGKLQAIAQEVKVEKSPFKSKTEAYFFALHNLMELAKTTDNEHVQKTIKEMQILIENHEQNPKNAATILTTLASKLENEEQQTLLHDITAAIQNSAYQQTLQEKYENPLARRFESEMQIALLKNPTDKMMKSVGHVSKALLNVIQQMEEQSFGDMLADFAANLTSRKEQTGFGSQPEPITIGRVKEILQKNDPNDLNQIMFIQFLFAQKQMRNLPESVLPPNRNEPTGKMLELVKEYNDGEYRDNPKAFFENLDSIKLRFISDIKIYGSELFMADPTRGRQGSLPQTFTSQMGVMLEGQNQEGLDVDRSSWTPDAKYQCANLDSPFTRDLIQNDAVYAAGPSGMTSLFMGIMENYGNFGSVEEKKNYLAAVSAYMVSGGLHSMHEVLGPAQYALDLIPGYQVSPPNSDLVANPPNFHQFYEQQMKLDPQFGERYQKGWENVMSAYARQKEQFVHAPISSISLAQQRVVAPKAGENPYAGLSEDKVSDLLHKNPELKQVNIDRNFTSSLISKNRDNKENYIDQNLMKINVLYIKGDTPKLEEAVDLLLKTVCKTRNSISKSYSTSTKSAQNLTDEICKNERLRKAIGIQGDNPSDWKKEIKVKMEAACKNEGIVVPDFSQNPGVNIRHH